MVKVFTNLFCKHYKGQSNREPGMYMNLKLRTQLDSSKRALLKDWDMCYVIDGPEGSGKSVLAQQIGFYLDPTLCIERVCFTPDEFRDIVIKSEKGKCIIFDEAYGGLASRRAMSTTNYLIVAMMAEIRQKNLSIILVLPSFFDLDKYAAIHRTRCLIHVYAIKFKRGYFKFYTYNKKKQMYLLGRRTYNYKCVKSAFTGRFTKFYPIDKSAYDKKKLDSLRGRGVPAKDVSLSGATVAGTSKFMESLNKVKALLDEGNSPDEIGVVMGVTSDTIRRYVKRLEVMKNMKSTQKDVSNA